MSDDYWFRQRRYGLGATPSNWKGWAFIAGYIVLLTGLMSWLGASGHDPHAHPLATVGFTITLTAVFVYICWRKTEGGWRWRWGDDDPRR
ncbi:MAG: hypothetical protein HY054_00885 [Proteobacteria bacterium]|nr:hypothetical protein [Pseudomonadota bacterium]